MRVLLNSLSVNYCYCSLCLQIHSCELFKQLYTRCHYRVTIQNTQLGKWVFVFERCLIPGWGNVKLWQRECFNLIFCNYLFRKYERDRWDEFDVIGVFEIIRVRYTDFSILWGKLFKDFDMYRVSQRPYA